MNRGNLALALVSDEVSPEFGEAVRMGKSWGVERYEIRTLRTGRIPSIADSEWREVRRIVDCEEVFVTAISPGLFKLPVTAEGEIARQIEYELPRSIDTAGEIGAGIVIIFGFGRIGGGTSDMVISHLARAADLADSRDIVLAVENEPGYWCDSGSNTAAILAAVDSPVLRANWDPANAFGCGEAPYPEGYRAIRDFIINVHAKDTSLGSLAECVPIGEGEIDWAGQITALAQEGRVEHVTVETHCPPLVEMSKRNIDTLRRMIDTAMGRR